MARTRCHKCKQFASFENTQPAVGGIAGRVHKKMGIGCKKDAVQVVKVAPKAKPVMRTFEEMSLYARGIFFLSSGLEVKLPRHKAPLVPTVIGGYLEFIPKSASARS